MGDPAGFVPAVVAQPSLVVAPVSVVGDRAEVGSAPVRPPVTPQGGY